MRLVAVIFVSLLVATTPLFCDTCASFDWGDIDTDKAGVPTTFEGVPHCDLPEDTACDADLHACGDITLNIYASTPGIYIPFSLRVQSCVDPSLFTCSSYEEEVLEALGKREGVEFGVSTCESHISHESDNNFPHIALAAVAAALIFLSVLCCCYCSGVGCFRNRSPNQVDSGESMQVIPSAENVPSSGQAPYPPASHRPHLHNNSESEYQPPPSYSQHDYHPPPSDYHPPPSDYHPPPSDYHPPPSDYPPPPSDYHHAHGGSPYHPNPPPAYHR